MTIPYSDDFLNRFKALFPEAKTLHREIKNGQYLLVCAHLGKSFKPDLKYIDVFAEFRKTNRPRKSEALAKQKMAENKECGALYEELEALNDKRNEQSRSKQR